MSDDTARPRRRTRRSAAADTDAVAGVPPAPPAPPDAGVPVDDQVREPVTGAMGDAPPPAGQAAPGTDRPGSITVERGAIGEATADRVDVNVGAIGRLDAHQAGVRWGAVGLARADRVSVEMGSLGAALATEAHVAQGYAGTTVAREAVLEQVFVRTLIANTVHAQRPVGVLVMIANRVSGDVRPLLDWRGALVAGVAFGVVSVLFRRLAGRA
jgi:hypothetical protein